MNNTKTICIVWRDIEDNENMEKWDWIEYYEEKEKIARKDFIDVVHMKEDTEEEKQERLRKYLESLGNILRAQLGLIYYQGRDTDTTFQFAEIQESILKKLEHKWDEEEIILRIIKHINNEKKLEKDNRKYDILEQTIENYSITWREPILDRNVNT